MLQPSSGALVDTLIQALMRVAPAAVLTLDTAGRITDLNAPAERLFSTTAARAIGQPYHAVLGPSLSDRVVGLFLRSGHGGAALEPQLVKATLPDGRRVELRANAGPVRDGGGKATEILFVAEEASSSAPPASEFTERLRTALRRYLGESIAEMVEQRPSFVGIGGTRRKVSVLQADIRGYTTVAEKLQPEDTMVLLLKYHGQAVAALLSEGATLDRFIGDNVLAIWNAPGEFECHAAGALRGALAVQRAALATGTELAYGIGVHTGEAVVGNIGSGKYMNYTAVGDTVNVAARLQAEAKAGQVLCSLQALADAGNRFEGRPLGPVQVRGRTSPVEVVELLGERMEDPP